MQIYPTDRCHADASVDLVFLTMSMGCGGTERVVSRLCEYFVGSHAAIAVVSIADQGEDFFKLPAEVTRLRLSSGFSKSGKWARAFSYIGLIRRLRTTLTKLGAHQVASFLPVPNVLLLAASVGLPVKTIVCERNNPYLQRELNLAWKILRRFCYPFADKITVNSDAAEEFCRIFRKRTEVIRLSNPPMLNIKPADPMANRVILYVGRIVHQKGIDILLAAAAQVELINRGWRLVLIGDGNAKSWLRERSSELGLDELIFWKDPTDDIISEYRNAAFVVLPSRFEGTSNAMLEALAMGLPVVASEAGASGVVINGFNGIVLQTLSAENLANALDRMTSDEDLREKLTSNCIGQSDGASFHQKMGEWEKLFDLSSTVRG